MRIQAQTRPLQETLTKICTSVMVSSLIMLSACGYKVHNTQNPNAQHPMQSNTENIENTKWVLISATPDRSSSLPNTILSETEEVTLQFNSVNNEDSFSFNVGCNINSGDYSLEDGIFKAGMVMSTEMFCEGIHKHELALKVFFRQDVDFNMMKVGNDTILTLTDNEGEQYQWKKVTETTVNADINLLNKAKTYRWHLAESNHPTLKLLPNNSTYQTKLSFENSIENRITYSICNTHGGKYTYETNNKVTAFNASNIFVTEKSCPSYIQNDEATLDNLMKQGGTIVIDTSSDAPKLIQTFDDNIKLIWNGHKKVYTATVKGKTVDTVTGNITEESKYYNNFTIPDDGFCASDNIYKYEFLTINFSNIQNGKCTQKGDSTYLSEIETPNSNKSYTYEIRLIEDFTSPSTP